VQSTNGDVFVTAAEVTIPVGGTVDVNVTADEFGAVRAAAATITTIITIVDARPGWTGVTNAAAVMVGREGVPDDAAQMALNSAVQFHNQTSRGTLLCAAHLATADGLVEILRSTEGPVSTWFAQFDGGTFWATTSYGREFRELEKRLPPVMFAV
ncbi:MAG: hypothetical protein OXI23_16060, partial [Gemmatimonadota bacterium]|nr:hypothetical protein [Gemmatimonadota bacterium]